MTRIRTTESDRPTVCREFVRRCVPFVDSVHGFAAATRERVKIQGDTGRHRDVERSSGHLVSYRAYHAFSHKGISVRSISLSLDLDKSNTRHAGTRISRPISRLSITDFRRGKTLPSRFVIEQLFGSCSTFFALQTRSTRSSRTRDHKVKKEKFIARDT